MLLPVSQSEDQDRHVIFLTLHFEIVSVVNFFVICNLLCDVAVES